jgi:hypothetical protein
MESVALTLFTYFLNIAIFRICASGKEDGHITTSLPVRTVFPILAAETRDGVPIVTEN